MRSLLALSAALLLTVPSFAVAATYTVKPGGDTKVVFVSKAPTETFEGKTNRMAGTLTLDPAAVGDSITVHLEVDMPSLTTGSKMRDEHMRERHLEVDKFPKAIFDGAAVLSPAGARLEAGKLTAFQVAGTFTLHGVTRRIHCDAQASLTPAGVAFSAAFPVALGDYQITRPEMLFLKLAEVQQVRVSATASSTPTK